MAVRDFYTDGDDADLTRSCVRKRGYPSEDTARRAARAVVRGSPHAQVRPYACRHCGMWHVGGVPASEQRFVPREPLDDSFDAERDRRRRDLRGKPGRRSNFGGRSRPARRREYD